MTHRGRGDAEPGTGDSVVAAEAGERCEPCGALVENGTLCPHAVSSRNRGRASVSLARQTRRAGVGTSTGLCLPSALSGPLALTGAFPAQSPNRQDPWAEGKVRKSLEL